MRASRLLLVLASALRLNSADPKAIGFIYSAEGSWTRMSAGTATAANCKTGDEIRAGDNLAVDGKGGSIRLVLYHQDELWTKSCPPCPPAIRIPTPQAPSGSNFLFDLLRNYTTQRPTPVVFTAARSSSVAAGPRPSLHLLQPSLDLSDSLKAIPPGTLRLTFVRQSGGEPMIKTLELNWGVTSLIPAVGMVPGLYSVEVQRAGRSIGQLAPLYIAAEKDFPVARKAFLEAQQKQENWGVPQELHNALLVKLFFALDERAGANP